MPLELTDDVIAKLDALVKSGRYVSREHAATAAITALLYNVLVDRIYRAMDEFTYSVSEEDATRLLAIPDDDDAAFSAAVMRLVHARIEAQKSADLTPQAPHTEAASDRPASEPAP